MLEGVLRLPRGTPRVCDRSASSGKGPLDRLEWFLWNRPTEGFFPVGRKSFPTWEAHWTDGMIPSLQQAAFRDLWHP